MEVKNGYLLISDISGYTEFLVQSELLHAKEILDTLLQTGIQSIRPPIRVHHRCLKTVPIAESPTFAARNGLGKLIDLMEKVCQK
jgi:hypothetical protein